MAASRPPDGASSWPPGRADRRPPSGRSRGCARLLVPRLRVRAAKGHAPEDAQDLTQGFFARLIEKGDLGDADRTRGRFRPSSSPPASTTSPTSTTARRRRSAEAASEFLHRSRGRAAHREVRAERVSQDVRSRVPRLVTGCEPCLARLAPEQVREHVGPERLTVLLTQHACALQVPMPLQRIRESGRHRDVPHAIAMTSRPAWSAWSSTRARPSAPWPATWT